jgi:hypothetical protein
MSAFVHEGTVRVPLGSFAIESMTSAPSGVPAAGTGIIDSVMTFDIGPTDVSEQRKQRFDVIELDFQMTGGTPVTEFLVTPYKSRKNPAAYNYGATDADADTWQSTGTQRIYRTPSESGGNVITIRMYGSRWLTVVYANVAGGPGTVTLYAYGLQVPAGGY